MLKVAVLHVSRALQLLHSNWLVDQVLPQQWSTLSAEALLHEGTPMAEAYTPSAGAMTAAAQEMRAFLQVSSDSADERRTITLACLLNNWRVYASAIDEAMLAKASAETSLQLDASHPLRADDWLAINSLCMLWFVHKLGLYGALATTWRDMDPGMVKLTSSALLSACSSLMPTELAQESSPLSAFAASYDVAAARETLTSILDQLDTPPANANADEPMAQVPRLLLSALPGDNEQAWMLFASSSKSVHRDNMSLVDAQRLAQDADAQRQAHLAKERDCTYPQREPALQPLSQLHPWDLSLSLSGLIGDDFTALLHAAAIPSAGATSSYASTSPQECKVDAIARGMTGGGGGGGGEDQTLVASDGHLLLLAESAHTSIRNTLLEMGLVWSLLRALLRLRQTGHPVTADAAIFWSQWRAWLQIAFSAFVRLPAATQSLIRTDCFATMEHGAAGTIELAGALTPTLNGLSADDCFGEAPVAAMLAHPDTVRHMTEQLAVLGTKTDTPDTTPDVIQFLATVSTVGYDSPVDVTQCVVAALNQIVEQSIDDPLVHGTLSLACLRAPWIVVATLMSEALQSKGHASLLLRVLLAVNGFSSPSAAAGVRAGEELSPPPSAVATTHPTTLSILSYASHATMGRPFFIHGLRQLLTHSLTAVPEALSLPALRNGKLEVSHINNLLDLLSQLLLYRLSAPTLALRSPPGSAAALRELDRVLPVPPSELIQLLVTCLRTDLNNTELLAAVGALDVLLQRLCTTADGVLSSHHLSSDGTDTVSSPALLQLPYNAIITGLVELLEHRQQRMVADIANRQVAQVLRSTLLRVADFLLSAVQAAIPTVPADDSARVQSLRLLALLEVLTAAQWRTKLVLRPLVQHIIDTLRAAQISVPPTVIDQWRMLSPEAALGMMPPSLDEAKAVTVRQAEATNERLLSSVAECTWTHVLLYAAQSPLCRTQAVEALRAVATSSAAQADSWFQATRSACTGSQCLSCAQRTCPRTILPGSVELSSNKDIPHQHIVWHHPQRQSSAEAVAVLQAAMLCPALIRHTVISALTNVMPRCTDSEWAALADGLSQLLPLTPQLSQLPASLALFLEMVYVLTQAALRSHRTREAMSQPDSTGQCKLTIRQTVSALAVQISRFHDSGGDPATHLSAWMGAYAAVCRLVASIAASSDESQLAAASGPIVLPLLILAMDLLDRVRVALRQPPADQEPELQHSRGKTRKTQNKAAPPAAHASCLLHIYGSHVSAGQIVALLARETQTIPLTIGKQLLEAASSLLRQ